MDDLDKRTQEYYDRKMRHREEMAAYVVGCVMVMVIVVIVASIVNILGGW